jgi:hypothetical protein
MIHRGLLFWSVAARSLQSEVEPLRTICMGILAQIKFNRLCVINVQNIDGASIKLLADFDRHGVRSLLSSCRAYSRFDYSALSKQRD